MAASGGTSQEAQGHGARCRVTLWTFFASLLLATTTALTTLSVTQPESSPPPGAAGICPRYHPQDDLYHIDDPRLLQPQQVHHHHHYYHLYPSIDTVSPSFHTLLNQTYHFLRTTNETLSHLPGAKVIATYVRQSYQDDPFRSFLELVLFVFAIKYVLTKRRKATGFGGLLQETLEEKEVDDLIQEWKPEPLVPPYGLPSSRPDSQDGGNASGGEDSHTSLSTVPFTSYWTFQTSKDPLATFTLAELDHLNASKEVILQSTFNGKPLPPNKCKPQHVNKLVFNCATFDFLGTAADPSLRDLAKRVVRKYGVGTCGPRGFYGTVDLHLLCEKQLSDFLGVEQAILFSQAFALSKSVIPAFAKRGDLIIADEGISFGLRKGIEISRANVIWYRHRDMNDLERVLLQIKELDVREEATRKSRLAVIGWALWWFVWGLVTWPFRSSTATTASSATVAGAGKRYMGSPRSRRASRMGDFKIPGGHRPPHTQRRFILTEGLFANTASVAPVDSLVRLKQKYKYRLILDDMLAFGVLGSHGRGTPEHFHIPTAAIDIYVGSLAHALGGGGAFVAAESVVIEHLRLSGAAYVFSASLPPVLAVVAMEVMSRLSREPETYLRPLREHVLTFRMALTNTALAKELNAPLPSIPHVSIVGDECSPMMMIQIPERSPVALKVAMEMERVGKRVVQSDDSPYVTGRCAGPGGMGPRLESGDLGPLAGPVPPLPSGVSVPVPPPTSELWKPALRTPSVVVSEPNLLPSSVSSATLISHTSCSSTSTCSSTSSTTATSAPCPCPNSSNITPGTSASASTLTGTSPSSSSSLSESMIRATLASSTPVVGTTTCSTVAEWVLPGAAKGGSGGGAVVGSRAVIHDKVLRAAEERLLQEIVDECLSVRSSDAVLLTRAKFIYDQEDGWLPKPSIRVCLTLKLGKRDVERVAVTLKGAVAKVMGRRR